VVLDDVKEAAQFRRRRGKKETNQAKRVVKVAAVVQIKML